MKCVDARHLRSNDRFDKLTAHERQSSTGPSRTVGTTRRPLGLWYSPHRSQCLDAFRFDRPDLMLP
jgi:hypothetical protein